MLLIKSAMQHSGYKALLNEVGIGAFNAFAVVKKNNGALVGNGTKQRIQGRKFVFFRTSYLINGNPTAAYFRFTKKINTKPLSDVDKTRNTG